MGIVIGAGGQFQRFSFGPLDFKRSSRCGVAPSAKTRSEHHQRSSAQIVPEQPAVPPARPTDGRPGDRRCRPSWTAFDSSSRLWATRPLSLLPGHVCAHRLREPHHKVTKMNKNVIQAADGPPLEVRHGAARLDVRRPGQQLVDINEHVPAKLDPAMLLSRRWHSAFVLHEGHRAVAVGVLEVELVTSSYLE